MFAPGPHLTKLRPCLASKSWVSNPWPGKGFEWPAQGFLKSSVPPILAEIQAEIENRFHRQTSFYLVFFGDR